ncbi:MAG TPA: PAS domain S-box protein, partial [Verrucomicrobiae bacterium]|nr:PAS domain S-box protein [Verrucomicrobiae bacterium]
DAQVVCRRDGVIIEANHRATALLGLDREPGLGAARLQTALTETVARRLATLLARKSGPQETLSAATLLSGGRLSMIADLQLTPLDGECSLVTIKNASRRWRMESHVQRLITAVDSTPDVVFVTDASFKITFVNAAFQGVTGHTIEDVLGRSSDFHRAPGQERVIQEYLAKIASGSDWTGELVNVRADGSTYPVEAVISPIYEKQGEFLGFAAFERDLSAKKKLQDELMLERNFVRSIINSLDSAVYTLDSHFNLTHANEGWRKFPAEHGLLKLEGEPEPGRSLLDYVPEPSKRAELQILFDFVLKKRQPEEIHATSADRQHHWLVKIAPWWHEGEVQGLIYIVSDHTYLHQLQSQLYQAQKMDTIGALAAGVAHDFNNLLLAIRGNISLLQLNDQFNDATRKRLQQIDSAANRAADITQQLLSFSRSSDERDMVVDLNQVVREASQLAKRTLKSRMTVRQELLPAPLKVRIDSTRAQQVLLNLCVNAQDAMPEGGELVITNARVQLNAAQASKATVKPGTWFARCSVADAGTGIPPEVLVRIFDPFFTTKEKGKGTGLGLSIVHSVVAKAGGFVEVETVMGEGTTFHIYLPEAHAGLTAAVKLSQAPLQKGSGRVLVVDDLDLVLDFTRSFLREAGYEVIVANSGEEAMELMEQMAQPVDLLFTDYYMTGMNGRQLMKEVSARWPTVKFILASGYLEDHERVQIETEFGARILHKPFHMREAIQMVADSLKR